MNISITGKVITATEDNFGVTLVIEQREGMRTNLVAVQCRSDALRRRALEFGKGDVVEAYGLVTSKRGSGNGVGRWFTTVEVENLRKVT